MIDEWFTCFIFPTQCSTMRICWQLTWRASFICVKQCTKTQQCLQRNQVFRTQGWDSFKGTWQKYWNCQNKTVNPCFSPNIYAKCHFTYLLQFLWCSRVQFAFSCEFWIKCSIKLFENFLCYIIRQTYNCHWIEWWVHFPVHCIDWADHALLRSYQAMFLSLLPFGCISDVTLATLPLSAPFSMNNVHSLWWEFCGWTADELLRPYLMLYKMFIWVI